MRNTPRPQEIYRHFKGNLYQIVTLAEHSETGEELVIYQAMYGEFKIYARPLSMFMQKVDRVKYPNVSQEYRFEMVSPLTENVSAIDMETEKEALETEPKMERYAEPKAEMKSERISEQATESEEEVLDIDPMVLEFLDASTYEERLNILAGLHHRITDDMINVMAVATDIEVKPGDVEERYIELRNCLMTLEKFECNRLR